MKDITGFPGYAITDQGQVYSYKSQRYLNVFPNMQVEYLQTCLWQDGKGHWRYVHRLVAEAFIPNPLGKPEVNHIDGNRHNNAFTNLEWVTSSENSFHASSTGLRVYTNQLTREEFIACLYDVIGGESYRSLSERVPYKVPFLSTKLRKIAREEGLEDDLDASLKKQRLERAMKNLEAVNWK